MQYLAVAFGSGVYSVRVPGIAITADLVDMCHKRTHDIGTRREFILQYSDERFWEGFSSINLNLEGLRDDWRIMDNRMKTDEDSLNYINAMCDHLTFNYKKHNVRNGWIATNDSHIFNKGGEYDGNNHYWEPNYGFHDHFVESIVDIVKSIF